MIVGQDGSILRKPFSEVSTMSVKPTTSGEKILLYGDIQSSFLICDRVGMTAELVAHIPDPNTGFPSGYRGLYGYFRTTSKVVIPGAVQVLKLK